MKLTILGLILMWGTSALAQATPPSLKDTLQWMQNTLDSGAGSLYMSKGDQGDVEKRELTMPDAKSCEVSFQYQTGPLEKYSYGVITKPTFKLVQKLNFRDIDPTMIIAGKPTKNGPADTVGPFVIFSATTRDNIKSISNISNVTSAFASDSLTFELPYPYSDQFTKAFKHAVSLCGGKASTF